MPCASFFSTSLFRCSLYFAGWLLALVLYLTPTVVTAQQNFQWRNFTRIGDGLSSNNVRSIAADHQGQIWLATSVGLSRFDGFWHTLNVPSGDVSQVFEDTTGFMWATTDDGIYRGIANRSLNQIDWEHHYSIDTGLIDNDILTAIQRGLDKTDGNTGEIWIGTPLGVSWFDGEIWHPVFNAADGRLNQGVQTIYEDQAGDLWFGLLPGNAADLLSHFDGIQWEVFGVDDGLPNGAVHTIVEDEAGNLWVGTTEGVAVYDGSAWQVFTTINSPLIDNNVHVIMRDREAVLWIGTTSGINLFDHGEWSQLTKANGLASNNIQAMFESEDGEIWVGTRDNGVSFSDRSWQPITTNDGLSDNQVITMLTDRNGDVWVGTRNGLSHYTTNGIETIDALRGREIRGLTEDAEGQGRIWVGSDQGFGMLDGTGWKDLRIEAETNEIQSVAIDLDGDVWVGTGILLPGEPGFLSSLNRYDGVQWHSEQEIFQQIDRTVVVMFVDSRGRIYFGTLGDTSFESGLWILDANLLSRLDLPASGDIRTIIEAADGAIWIGTEVGIHVLDSEILRPTTLLTTDQGLVDNSVQVLHRDQNNRIWIGTADGVSLVQDGQFERTLTASDGLNSNNTSAITEVGETLWFGSADDTGISVFNPEMTPPRTRITSGPTQGETIGDTSVIFKFEGGDASTPTAALRYIYQLDGAPSMATDDRGLDKRVLLSNLDEGFHHFTVRAIDREGNIDPVGATAEFTVDSILPRVSISNPKPDDVIRGTYLIEGTATDQTDFLDYQIQIFAGNGLSGQPVLATPFFSIDPVEVDTLYSWNTQTLPDGTYTIWLFARDTINGAFDQQHSDETNVTIQVDNTPPSVNIQSPMPESTISGNAIVLIELTDAHLNQYTLEYSPLKDADDADWIPIRGEQISESSVVVVAWDTSASDGQIYLRTRAQDLAGNISSPEIISYVLDNEAARPIVAILEPVEGATPVSGEVVIIGTVDVGIAEGAMIEEILLEYREISGGAVEWTEIRSFAARGRRFNTEEIARWNTEEVPDGEYQLRLTATDDNAYKSETTRDLILDNTHPTASITSPQDDVVLAIGNIDVTGTATDDHFSQYELKVLQNGSEEVIPTANTPVEDGLLARWNTTNLEGEYTLRLIVRDEAGLESSAEVNVILDAGEVIARISSPKADEFVGDTVQVIGTVQDKNFNHYELEFRPADSSSPSPRGRVSVPNPDQQKNDETLGVWETPSLDEQYELHLVAFDLSSKQSEHTVSVFIDNLEPQAQISAPTDMQLLSDTIEIIGTADDAHFQEYQLEFRFADRLDEWIPILDFPSTQQKRAEVLASWDTPQGDDEYDIRLIVRDRSGKSSTASVRVTIDNEPPQVRIDQPTNNQPVNEFVGDSVQVIGTVQDENFSHYELEFRPADSSSSSPRGQISVFAPDQQKNAETLGVWETPSLDETYELHLMAFDLSGKQSEHTVSVFIDNLEPQAEISAPTDMQILSGSVEIVGTAEDAHFQEYQLEFRFADRLDEWTPILDFPSTQRKRAEVLASWDTPQGDDEYDIRLIVRDQSGKSSTVTMRVTIDNQPPQVQIDRPTDNQLVSETVEIRGIAADTNLAMYRLDVRVVDGGATWQEIIQSDDPIDDQVVAEWTPPEVEGEYEIRLTAQDRSGRPAEEKRVTVIVDRIPPEAEILFPIENQQLPQRIELRGTANDRNFREYIIEYSIEESPDIWLPISKPPAFLNPVTRDTLGVWNASGLSGRFTLRLRVEDSAGHRASDRVQVFLSPGVERTTGGIVQSQDGRAQIIFPPNSLPDRTVVTINPVSDAQTEKIEGMGKGGQTSILNSDYEFAPTDLSLHNLKPATIEFVIDDGQRAFSGSERLTIVRREGGTWRPVGGTVDTQRRKISTAILTLGRYAVTTMPAANPDVNATITDLTCQPRLFSPNRGEATAISFRLNRTNNVTVKIYNEAGRLRRVLKNSEQLSAGSHVFRWDGRDDDGQLVVSNFYVVTVEGEGTRATKAVIVKND